MQRFTIIGIFLFLGFLALSGSNFFAAESDPVKETQDYIKSGAIFGKNMSISRDIIALEVLKNVSIEKTSYCLKIGNALATEPLLSMLRNIGHVADSCSGEQVVEVHVNNFSETSRGEFQVYYSYFCGRLCAGGFDCRLSTNSENELIFQSCKLKWIS